LATLVPLVVILGVEGFLRLVGYGYPVTFFLESGSADRYTTNPKFIWQFQQEATPLKPWLASLPAQKAPGTIRICILGESAAMGTPDPAFGFGRILEVQLRRQFPDRRFEIVNAAMRGINSHVIRVIERECEQHQIDCFVIYMGNNEVIGLHGPDPSTRGWMQSLTWIRANHALRSSKLGQVTQALLRRNRKQMPEQTMAGFRAHSLAADDWRRNHPRFLEENFAHNLELVHAIEEMARAKGVTAAQLALAWVLAQGDDVVPIPGTRSIGRLEENVAALDIVLSREDLARLDDIVPAAAVAGMRYGEAGMRSVQR